MILYILLFIAIVAIGVMYWHEIYYSARLLKRHMVKVAPWNLRNIGNTNCTISEEEFIRLRSILKTDGIKLSYNKLIHFNIMGGDVNELISAIRQAYNNNLGIITEELLTDIYYAGGNMEDLVNVAKKAQNAAIDYDLNELVIQHLPNGMMDKFITCMIKSKKSGNQIAQEDLLHFYKAGGDIEKYTNAVIKSNKLNLNISLPDYITISMTGGDVEKFTDVYIESIKAGLQLPINELLEHNLDGDTIVKIVKYLIKFKETGISVSIEEMIDYARTEGDIEKMANNLIKAQKANIPLTLEQLEGFQMAGLDFASLLDAFILNTETGSALSQEEIIDHALAGGHPKNFVNALFMATVILNLEGAKAKLESHFLKGGDPNTLIIGLVNAQKLGVEVPYPLASAINIMGNLIQTVSDTVNPQNFLAENIKAVSQDGTILIMNVSITVKFVIGMFMNGSGFEVIKDRVHEAIVSSVIHFETYKDVLKNIPLISKMVLKKLLGEEEPEKSDVKDKFTLEEEIKIRNERQKNFNSKSKYEVIEISVPEINIAEDTTAEIKKQQAEIKAGEIITKAKAMLLQAEADVEQAYADAIRSGRINLKDIHKNMIFNERKTTTRVEDESHEKESHDDHHDAHSSH